MAAVEVAPRESPIYGGCRISVSVTSEVLYCSASNDDHYYLVYEGSELRHLTYLTMDSMAHGIQNHLSFSGLTPGHNKPESVRVSLYRSTGNDRLALVGTSRHFFMYDGTYQLAQYVLNCHLTDQLYRLGDDDLEEICDVKLQELSAAERSHLDKCLERAFSHIIAKHGPRNVTLLYQTSVQGIRAQDTLVHFACRYGMLKLVNLLLQLPGGEDCLNAPDTDGQLPIDLAQNAGCTDLVNFLSSNNRLPIANSNDDEPHVITTNLNLFCRDLEYDISELNRLMNIQGAPSSSLVTCNAGCDESSRSNRNVIDDVVTDSENNVVPSVSAGDIDDISAFPLSPVESPTVFVPITSTFDGVYDNGEADIGDYSHLTATDAIESPQDCREEELRSPINLTDEDKTSKMNAINQPSDIPQYSSNASSSPSASDDVGNRILEGNIRKLRLIHDGIQQMRLSNTQLQVEEQCEDRSVQPSQSWPSLSQSDVDMNNEEATSKVLPSGRSESHPDAVRSIKIRVNDITPSGSQELLCMKSSSRQETCENAKETVDGCYGNVKRQLEQKKQRAVKETRRQSWSGDRDQSSSVVATGLPSTDKSHHSHSSLSSMESDNDETFFDAQDSSSVCKRTNSKPKRPSSLGDADIAGVPTEATGDPDTADYGISRSSPNSLSLQYLCDVGINVASEPSQVDDLCSKSLSEHQLACLGNSRLAPPRSLLKSVSTPSIIAVNDTTENWKDNQQVVDDAEGVLPSRIVCTSTSPSHDSDDDKPFKRKKRSSLFFKKKWGKEKESKKSTHQFVTVCYSNSTMCDVCTKSLCNKQAWQCETCLVKVHENSCREHVSDCSKFKHPKGIVNNAGFSHPHSTSKDKLTTSSSFRSHSTGISAISASQLVKPKRQSEVSFSTSALQEAINLNAQKNSGSSPSKVISEDKEAADMLEETHLNIVDTNSASVESLEDGSGDDSGLDDDIDLQLRNDEPEQWSSLVDKKFTKKMKDKDVKRQESIYELILTEKHHVLTLKIMQKIFAHGMKKELRMSSEIVDRIFPGLCDLYEMHSSFLRLLRERQREYTVIPTIGDLLVQQFQNEKADRLTTSYGEFCSQHQDAISLYKDILKTDRKFQLFIKKCSFHPDCKARAIPECMLLVTQRITKYPLVLNSIIKATRDNDEEKENLIKALDLVKDIITKVEGKVAEKQKELRLLEIYNKIDAKSTAFYRGKKFKKSDLLSGKRKLDSDGTLIWKSARGKPFEVITIVLSDIILFLQENNQKYSFVSQDNKCAILSLQKLLIREKAGQDNRGIYLISSNPLEPEMYELSCLSSKDKNDWVKNIRRAIECCPDEDDTGNVNDYNADRKLIDVRLARMKHLLASLHDKDLNIAQICEEKMAILIELLETDVKSNFLVDIKYTRLLDNKCDPSETRSLLMASLNEASRIASSLYVSGSHLSRSVSSVGEHQSGTFITPMLPKRAETFGGFDSPSKEPNPLHKCLKKKLMMLKENGSNVQKTVGGTSVSCTVSPVSEEGGELLRPTEEQKKLKRIAISTNNLSSGNNATIPKQGNDWTDSMTEDTVSQSSTVGELLSLNAVTPSLLIGNRDQLSAAVRLTHHLNRLQCLFSQHFTSYEKMKAEYSEILSRPAHSVGESGRDTKDKRSYKHNQQLEELRNLQEQLREERQAWEKQRNIQQKNLEESQLELTKLQEQLREDQLDVKEQRDRLYQQLEVLKRQGILLSPSLTVVNTSLHSASSPQLSDADGTKTQNSSTTPDQISSWELRATKGDQCGRKTSVSSADHKQPLKLTESKSRNVSTSSVGGHSHKRGDVDTRHQAALPVHLCSATNQQKVIHNNPVVSSSPSVRQQLPMKLANLSAGSQENVVPNAINQQQVQTGANVPAVGGDAHYQVLPMKLAALGGKQLSKSNPIRTSSFGGSRVGSPPGGTVVHQRAGSSPAKMPGPLIHGDETNQNLQTRSQSKDRQDPNKRLVSDNSSEQEIIYF